MVVAIEMRLGRTQERSTWEGGIQGACLLFRRCLGPALSDDAGAGLGATAGG